MDSFHEDLGKLNCILPSDYLIDGKHKKELGKGIAVVIHLHYSDTFDTLKKYIDNIPEELTIYFTCSNEELRRKLQLYSQERKNCRIIPKKNRGRDISSFLVACREEILKYQFFCFVHDKKEKIPEMKKDTDKWIYSLWENMLGTTEYIWNIIRCFDKNSQLGLLLPPLVAGDWLTFLYGDNWYDNYENTIKLANTLNLDCKIEKENSPMALGTVFWARVDALRKILEYEWKYEDFDPEPLAYDGTLSHAIERIIEYVAKDAGYECKWVMTNRYAEESMEFNRRLLCNTFEILSLLGIKYINEVKKYKVKSETLKNICKNYKKIYIYGAGQLGTYCNRTMFINGIKVDSFIVTDMNGNKAMIDNIPVHPVDEIKFDQESFVLVATKKRFQEEIFQKLKDKNLDLNATYNWNP